MLIYAAIGLAAGILSGFFGIGGGIIIVPTLMYFAGFSQLMAQGTSLAVMLPPVGILAFWEYYKKGNVDITAGILICITLLIGGMVGGKIAQIVPPPILKKCFAVFLMLVSVKMLLGK
ncbi:MAG: sulfite exporter TauE/SafE family protein [Pelosinus sp.]|nr:sulfite exporter TauE/SafE family protein [Pelosinus sp.]